MKNIKIIETMIIILTIHTVSLASSISELDKKTFEHYANTGKINYLEHELKKETPYTDIYFYIKYNIGRYYYKRQDYENAIKILQHVIIDIDERSDDYELIHECQFILAQIYEEKGDENIEDLLKAYTYYTKAIGLKNYQKSLLAKQKRDQIEELINQQFLNNKYSETMNNCSIISDYYIRNLEEVTKICIDYRLFDKEKNQFNVTLKKLQDEFDKDVITTHKLELSIVSLKELFHNIKKFADVYPQLKSFPVNLENDYHFWNNVCGAYIAYKIEEKSGSYTLKTYQKFKNLFKENKKLSHNSKLNAIMIECNNKSLFRSYYVKCNKESNQQDKYNCFKKNIFRSKEKKNHEFLTTQQKNDYLFFINFQPGKENKDIQSLKKAILYAQNNNNEQQLKKVTQEIVTIYNSKAIQSLHQINKIDGIGTQYLADFMYCLSQSNEYIKEAMEYEKQFNSAQQHEVKKFHSYINLLYKFHDEFKLALDNEQNDPDKSKKHYKNALQIAYRIPEDIKIAHKVNKAAIALDNRRKEIDQNLEIIKSVEQLEFNINHMNQTP